MTLENIATSENDELVYDATQPIQTKTVKLPSGDGIVERGTIVALSDEGDAAVWEAGDTSGAASYIVADDVDTGTDDGSTVVALVYCAGKFTREAVAQAAALTAAAEKELENAGIYLASIA